MPHRTDVYETEIMRVAELLDQLPPDLPRCTGYEYTHIDAAFFCSDAIFPELLVCYAFWKCSVITAMVRIEHFYLDLFDELSGHSGLRLIISSRLPNSSRSILLEYLVGFTERHQS